MGGFKQKRNNKFCNLVTSFDELSLQSYEKVEDVGNFTNAMVNKSNLQRAIRVEGIKKNRNDVDKFSFLGPKSLKENLAENKKLSLKLNSKLLINKDKTTFKLKTTKKFSHMNANNFII